MLKNISSVISPDLLWLLASMGHGDDLVLVDRNFPAIQVAKQTSTGRLIELAGLNIPAGHACHSLPHAAQPLRRGTRHAHESRG